MESSASNYEVWQHRDLVQRVHDLERQLHERTAAAVKYKTPKKQPKPFDASKYSTRKIALKFAYLGAKYNGFEHHTNNITPVPTIEEVIWRALKKTRLILPEYKAGQDEDEICWDGLEYSKCGRTDKGVSAFGQVIALKVRSARPLQGDEDVQEFDLIKDELPYVQLLNRVLPPEIRILAWCAELPDDFSARFNCRERRYRYFFTNPGYLPSSQNKQSDGWLDVEAMQKAAEKYQGLHDFRNFCKIDPSKQITNFERRIFYAGIHKVGNSHDGPEWYYFEVRGSAFLWHQVRHLVAVLFLVGQRYEDASIVDQLLDVQSCPARPLYEMASDVPLVLWECIFPDLSSVTTDHVYDECNAGDYKDAMPWIYVDDGAVDKPNALGIMEGLWSMWREKKLNELLASQLMDVVQRQGSSIHRHVEGVPRLFDGSNEARNTGPYKPVMQRDRMETVDVVNARYAARRSIRKHAEAEANE